MDKRAAVYDLRPGKLVVAVLAPGRKHITGTERSHETEHGQTPEGIERQGIAEVETNGMGTIALDDRPQARGDPAHGFWPRQRFVATVRLPSHGPEQAVGMSRQVEKACAFGADEAATDRMLSVGTEPMRTSIRIDLGNQAAGRLTDTAKRLVCHGACRTIQTFPGVGSINAQILTPERTRIKSDGFAMALHFCIARRSYHRVLCFSGSPPRTTGRRRLPWPT
jgi:hypothetical protein